MKYDDERVYVSVWTALDSFDGGYTFRWVHFSVPASWVAQRGGRQWATSAEIQNHYDEELLRDAVEEGVVQWEEGD